MKPSLCVLMSAYQPLKSRLDATIASVLSQSLTDFEFIIVKDDNSIETLRWIEQWQERDPRIVIVDNQTNIGLIASLNKGLDLATGELIARIDVGDTWNPYKLEKQKQRFDNDIHLVVCATSFECVDEQNNIIGSYNVPVLSSQIMSILMSGSNPFAHSSAMFKKTSFRYNPMALYCEDFELWCRYSTIGHMEGVNESLMNYLIEELSLSHQKRALMIINTNKVFCAFVQALLSKDTFSLTQGIMLSPVSIVPNWYKISSYFYSKGVNNLLAKNRLVGYMQFIMAGLFNPILFVSKGKQLLCATKWKIRRAN